MRLACGVSLLLLLTAIGCDSGKATAVSKPTVLRIGVPEGVVAGTDLGLQDLAAFLSVEGLTQLSHDGRAMPRLAESWTWERDGTSLRIVLRPQVVLHDGTSLTASLAADLVRTAVERPSSRQQFTSLSDIRSVRADGDGEIVIDLDRRSAFLPEDLELRLAVGPGRIGTGPYRVVEQSSEIVMERFDKYYGGIPRIEQVVIKPFGQLRTAWAGLLRGELDMVTNVPPDAVQFINNDEVDVFSFEYRYQYLVAFNSRRPPFNSHLVRRALNYAVDRQALIKDVLQGRGNASTGPLWPKHWAYDTSIAPFGLDTGFATSLLNTAGVQPATRREGRPPSRFRFTCLIPAHFSLLERVALHVQKQLYNIGIDMQFEVVPIEKFDARVRAGQFEAMMIDMLSGPSMGRAYNFWGSARNVKGFNFFGYENAEAERLFGVLRTSTNEAAVRSATSNLQRVLLDDPPALFLAWQLRSRAIRRDFQVIQEPDRDPVTTIWRWTAAARTGTVQ
jgi:peptide/nickel transport system substrate-binding protein